MDNSPIEIQRPLDPSVFRRWVTEGWRLPMLTCYDAATARSLQEAAIPLLLVGDSLGPAVLGLESVRDVTVEMIAYHTAAVRRGALKTPIVADLPFESVVSIPKALYAANRLLDAGADMVKIEAGADDIQLVSEMVDRGFVVMGHVGHKPQRYVSGPRVTGAQSEDALQVYKDAMALQKAGASVVLFECIPARVAAEITKRLKVPTIGIGAGAGCRGQVLVIADLLGWTDKSFRFLIKLENFYMRTCNAAKIYAEKVRSGVFPDDDHSFRIEPEVLSRFMEKLPPLE